MNLLLDTHAFLWMLFAPEKLSARAIQAHDNPATVLHLSVVTLWEIQIKTPLGKLVLDVPLAQIVQEQVRDDRYRLIEIRAEHVLALDDLPRPHSDPFDRLLIAQSHIENLPLVSADSVFAQYPVQLFW